MEIIWTKTARNDLNEIVEYIANDSVEIALKKYFEIRESTKQLNKFPEQGRIIPELKNENLIRFREIIISPWHLMYKIENKKFYIMAVIDGRRNIEGILMKRMLR
ncbi:MAG TPA: plasmid stabilization protein [Spirochaeta sp.]|nr:plasmid stabilization protein [Spirochaeta sp.]